MSQFLLRAPVRVSSLRRVRRLGDMRCGITPRIILPEYIFFSILRTFPDPYLPLADTVPLPRLTMAKLRENAAAAPVQQQQPAAPKSRRPAVKWDHRKDKYLLLAIFAQSNISSPDYKQLSELMGSKIYSADALKRRFIDLKHMAAEVMEDRQYHNAEINAYENGIDDLDVVRTNEPSAQVLEPRPDRPPFVLLPHIVQAKSVFSQLFQIPILLFPSFNTQGRDVPPIFNTLLPPPRLTAIQPLSLLKETNEERAVKAAAPQSTYEKPSTGEWQNVPLSARPRRHQKVLNACTVVVTVSMLESRTMSFSRMDRLGLQVTNVPVNHGVPYC
ncbi:uncharacterized protein BJX67DRAFT_349071 [Aspergillus lucknowensis]|uniref:Uncharacterized protein n=1 Tax=Aspergillus lucknowensis TaxID=176173 RepID=A0ABR4LW08_9EURO